MEDQVRIHIRIPETGEKQKVIWLCPGMAGDDRYFLIGNEFGATHLICAGSFDAAWEEWLDNQPAISDGDLYIAFGFDSAKDLDAYIEKRTTNCEDWDLDLVEGYEYMPNFGGTNGIVDVSEYIWQREVTHLLKRKGLPKESLCR